MAERSHEVLQIYAMASAISLPVLGRLIHRVEVPAQKWRDWIDAGAHPLDWCELDDNPGHFSYRLERSFREVGRPPEEHFAVYFTDRDVAFAFKLRFGGV